MKAKLMAHLVAGYPDPEGSFQTARALVDAGCTYLEIQFPFSDPSADGPAIQAACTEALDGGFKVEAGWDLVDRLKAYAPGVPIFIMSYASIVYTIGVKNFVAQSKKHGVTGLIIPDLAPGDDEGLYAEGTAQGVAVVPVIVPTVSPARLKMILDLKPEFIYTAIRAGITGSHTELTPELVSFLGTLNNQSKVLAGFGIDSRAQVEALTPAVHSLVVGSAFVREVAAAKHGGPKALYIAVLGKARELVG